MASNKTWLSDFRRSATVARSRSFDNFTKFKRNYETQYNKVLNFAGKHPFPAFFISLAILLLVIILGSTVFKTKTPVLESRSRAKNVSVYRLSDTPKINVQGEVKKGSVITVVALMPGVVSSINKTEGQQVNKNEPIINLSSNYQGGNAISVQRQMAGVTYKNTKETYDIQKDLIAKQREIANLNSTNAVEMRKLTQTSVDSTRTQVNFNAEIIRNIKSNVLTLQNSGGDPALIQGLIQAQAQIQSGQNQLEAALRGIEYSVDPNKPPVKLEGLGKEIALKQIDIQEKALKMGLDVAGLQLQLAEIQEANMFPSSPFSGVIEKINVKVGDNVNPGMPLFTISGGQGNLTIDTKVPQDIALNVSRFEFSTINISGKKIQASPSYISTEATDGQLYSIVFTIDKIYESYFTDKSFVNITLPLGPTLRSDSLMIPIDSVFQTQEGATVYVVQNNKAVAKKVSLGDVTGSFVKIINGITLKDTIITTRNVINGDSIKVEN